MSGKGGSFVSTETVAPPPRLLGSSAPQLSAASAHGHPPHRRGRRSRRDGHGFPRPEADLCGDQAARGSVRDGAASHGDRKRRPGRDHAAELSAVSRGHVRHPPPRRDRRECEPPVHAARGRGRGERLGDAGTGGAGRVGAGRAGSRRDADRHVVRAAGIVRGDDRGRRRPGASAHDRRSRERRRGAAVHGRHHGHPQGRDAHALQHLRERHSGDDAARAVAAPRR